MAPSTHGLSARLHAMEARLDCMTNTIEQLHDRMDHMSAALNRSMAIQNTVLDMMYKLQPLANFLSPLSSVLNPRNSSTHDSGLGDKDFGATDAEKDDSARSASTELSQTPSLRRRRGCSNLKADHIVLPSLKFFEEVGDDLPIPTSKVAEDVEGYVRSGIIHIAMTQDAAFETTN